MAATEQAPAGSVITFAFWKDETVSCGKVEKKEREAITGPRFPLFNSSLRLDSRVLAKMQK